MGKKSKSVPGRAKPPRPFVSICTPTFNRRPFIPTMFDIFHIQDYPKDRVEWIIVDDGTDPIRDLVESSGISQIKYHYVKEKLSLGAKRNYMHSLISPKSEYIIYFDDDDWYPHDRISHSIEMLEKHPGCLIAGSSELYCYFKEIKTGEGEKPAQLIQFGPYGPNHSTAGTFCFHRKLLEITQYDPLKELAEEKDFLKNYTIPMCQLDPIKTILVFSHLHNTFDKRTLLTMPQSQFMKPSNKSVDVFFRRGNAMDQKIRRFFMEEIDGLLTQYEPGEPKNKPNVIKQMAEIKEEREKQMRNAGGTTITIQRNGEAPKTLTAEEIIQLLQSQQQQIDYLTKHAAELEKQCIILQMKLI